MSITAQAQNEKDERRKAIIQAALALISEKHNEMVTRERTRRFLKG